VMVLLLLPIAPPGTEVGDAVGVGVPVMVGLKIGTEVEVGVDDAVWPDTGQYVVYSVKISVVVAP